MPWDMKATLTPNNKSGSTLSKIGLLLAVLGLTAMVYASLPSCDFIFIDDSSYVVENTDIRDFTSSGIQKIAFSFFKAQLPVTLASFAIDYKLWGLDPGPYHAENVVFHLLNVLLVFFLISLLSRKYEVALLTALFFGIHPYRVESVAWIVERKDMLYAFFYLLGLISYVFYIRKKFKIHFLIFTIFLFLFSLMSKTAAIIFPAVLFLIDYLEGRKISFRLFFEKAPLFFIAATAAWVHHLAASASTQLVYREAGLEFSHRIFMAFYAFSYYVLGFFAPHNFCFAHIYPYAKSLVELPPIYYFSPVFVLLFLWGMDHLIKKSQEERKSIVFGFLFFLISIALVLHLIPMGGSVVVAERYTYMAYLGLFFMASTLFVKFIETPKKGISKIKVLLCILLVGYIAFFALATERRCKIWKDSLFLLDEVVEKNPEWATGYTLRAIRKFHKGDARGAAGDFDKGIRLAPHMADLYFYRGVFRENLKDYRGAIADLTRAIELLPGAPEAYCARGAVYMETQNYASALKDYSKAVAVNPNRGESYAGRGSAKSHLGDPEGALSDYTMALQLNPSLGSTYFDRGALYLDQGRFDEAFADFNQALKKDPDMKGVYFNRAVCYFHKEQYAKAWEEIHQAQRIGEELPEQFLKQLRSKMQESITDPLRAKGITVFFVFREFAQAMNIPRGFSIKQGSKLLPVPNANALMDFFLKQKKIVQENGIWLLGEDLDFYCNEDRLMELELKSLCQKHGIPLFKTTNKDFPKGWKRVC
jgi:tetratricopeptide (TPR) repeat protein